MDTILSIASMEIKKQIANSNLQCLIKRMGSYKPATGK